MDLHKNTWRQCAAGIRPIGEPLPPVDNFLIAELEHAQKGPRLLKTVAVSILFTVLVFLAAWGIAECGRAHAQGFWPRIGDPCELGGEHPETKSPGVWRKYDGDNLLLNCEPADGKPPRVVISTCAVRANPDNPASTCLVPAYSWECDKGYELDGATIIWRQGMPFISPDRCKAVQK
jgi:hypothetical protein